jgi:hypothetical protein
MRQIDIKNGLKYIVTYDRNKKKQFKFAFVIDLTKFA